MAKPTRGVCRRCSDLKPVYIVEVDCRPVADEVLEVCMCPSCIEVVGPDSLREDIR
jgi:hypothetical protein